MKYGNLISIILVIIGTIGVAYGISLNDDSTIGVVIVSGATVFPIAMAIQVRMRELRSNDFFHKELKFTDKTKSKVDSK